MPIVERLRLGVMACGSPELPEMSRKAKGTYSTSGKRLMGEVVYPMPRQTRSVWSRLHCLNPSFQGVKAPAEETTAKILLPPIPGSLCCPGNTPGRHCMPTRHDKGANGRPKRTYHVQLARNSGSPTGRESYGDGDPIVVRDGESPSHGEGGQVLGGVHQAGGA
jgi:hypothetical protein